MDRVKVLALCALAGCSAKADVCSLNSDCPSGFYCQSRQCMRDCIVSNLDCPSGFVCNAIGKCEPASQGDGGGPPQDGAVGDGPAGDGPQPDLSTSDGPAALKQELDRCSADGDCAAPLVCRAFEKNGTQRCTRTCTSTATCLAGERCLTDAMSTQTCIGEDVGRPCTAAGDCNFACLLAQKYCTAPCASGADCPNGWGCMPVGTPPQNVCINFEAACSAADASACVATSACDQSAALLVASCTGVCNTAADCPRRAAGLTPWTCDGAGICRRPGDVYGPLAQGASPAQYACNAASTVVNVCSDAQHIDFAQFTVPSPPAVTCGGATTTAGVAGDACVDSCRYQGGCVRGYACTALGSIGGNRIGLCLPVGPNEVGQPCTTDGNCAFGYCNRTAGTCSRDCTFDGVCPSGSTCTAAGGPAVEGAPFKRCQ